MRISDTCCDGNCPAHGAWVSKVEYLREDYQVSDLCPQCLVIKLRDFQETLIEVSNDDEGTELNPLVDALDEILSF